MKKPCVLIVDDAPANLKLARVALESADFEVHTANDGSEALALLPRIAPDLILMDLQMPGLDGYELTRRIKAQPERQHIRIVAVTAYAMKGDRERALEAGCDGYITKPLDPILLPGLVASHIGGPAPEPSVAPLASQGVILVVEDNPTSRKLIRVALESEGYEVSEAAEAREALAFLEGQRPALILQDLVLPDLDGLELVQRIRGLPNGRGVPILCLSGFLARMDAAKALKDGFSALLHKPIDPIVLLETVRVHLERPRSAPPILQDAHGISVMVVDDDPLQRRLAEYHLAGAGFRVRPVANARDALALAQEAPPDAIVSDVLMPDMDGFELCMCVRRHPQLSKIPVVLVSSHYTERADEQLAAQIGASAFVPRSGDWAHALHLLRKVLGQPLNARPSLEPDAAREAILRRTQAQLAEQLRANQALGQRCLLQTAQLSVLAGVADALTREQGLSGVLSDVLSVCLDLAGISKGALYLLRDGQLIPHQAIGWSSDESAGVASFFGHMPLLERIIAQGQVTGIPSAAISSEEAQDILQRAGINGALLVPVPFRDRFYGALLLGARDTEVTGAEPTAFARVLSGQMGQAIGLADAFERLYASEQQFRALVSSMEDVVVVDRAHRVIGTYGQLAQNPQVHADAGEPIEALLSPEAPSTHRAPYARALAGESVVYEWTRGTGPSARHFQDALWPVRNPHGHVQSVVRVSREVTEQRKLQAQVMVQDRMASVGMLAAGVAHEINNPLMAMLGNVQLALAACHEDRKRGQPPADDSVESLQDALEASRRVESIVRDLRLFSRADGEVATSVDVHDVLESTLRMARNEIRHRAQLIKNYGPVPPVRASDSRLGQVFLNLLINAAQAIPEGHADRNEIRVRTSLDPAGQVLVEISDTGCGIPEELGRRLFAPFVTTKPVGVGTGLGLAICQRIVASLGGNIAFESEPGHGTTFRVSLPPDTQPALARRAEPITGPAARRGRVLMIDDEAMLGSLVGKALKREHDVVYFADAREALTYLRREAPADVILCDLMMPVMSGVEFYEELARSKPELARRVVFLTGGAFTPGARAFLERVKNARLEKPLELAGLRKLVNELIR